MLAFALRPPRLSGDSRPARGHTVPMKFLEQVQADLKQAVLQHQRDLLVTVLQGRSGELTLGDLRKLLASPLGRGLDDLRVAELFAGPDASPGKIGTKVSPGRRTRGAADKRSSQAAKGPARSKKVPLEDLLAAVFATLRSAKKPLSSTQVAAKVKMHRTTVRDLLHKLSAANRVVISGSRQFTRYALPEAGSGAHREEQAGKVRGKKKVEGAKNKATKAQQRAALPAVLTQADYDAAVLANLNATGSMSSSQLQASVGGSLNEVRAALQRLIENHQAVRVGQRKNTRYVPAGSKGPGE